MTRRFADSSKPPRDLADELPAMGAGHNPAARPLRGYNVRLNDWELQTSKLLAKSGGRSLQNWLRLLIHKACENRETLTPDSHQIGTTE